MDRMNRTVENCPNSKNQDLSDLTMPGDSGLRVLLASTGCGGGGSCPTVYTTPDGKIALQGFKLSHEARSSLAIPEGEDIVVLPREFVEQLARKILHG